MTALTYSDAYLSGYITTEIEDRAYSDVDALGVFDPDALTGDDAYWRDRMTVLRAYVITCLDKQAQPDDLFAAKLKNYQREFDAVLKQAREYAGITTNKVAAITSIPILRG